jgi:hypothetical protein
MRQHGSDLLHLARMLHHQLLNYKHDAHDVWTWRTDYFAD